jgi:cytoskeletal protein CcmA (bactofilin family)
MSKRAFLLLIVVFILLISGILPAQAAETRSGNTVAIRSNQVINDDLYASGAMVSISGDVNGDLIVAGGTVDINGYIRDDLMVCGGNVNINGPVGQTIRVAGGNVVINSSVGHDVVVVGGTVDFSDESSVKNDVLVSGGTVGLNGIIDRNLGGAAGAVTVGGIVGGDTTLTVSQLTLLRDAELKGNLTYTSENKAKIESGATVRGKTAQKQPPVKYREPTPGQKATALILMFLFSFIAAYISGVILLLLFPTRTRDIANTVLKSPWASLGIGFLALIVVPIALFILLFFIVTIPVSLTVLFIYLLGLYLAKIFVGLAIGRWIFGYFKWMRNDFLALLVGLLIVMLLALIPVIGWLLRFLYILFGLGAAVMSIFRMIESGRKQERQATIEQMAPPSEPGGPAGPEQPEPTQ